MKLISTFITDFMQRDSCDHESDLEEVSVRVSTGGLEFHPAVMPLVRVDVANVHLVC